MNKTVEPELESLRTRADFRRMVSWELSEVKERLMRKNRKRKRSQVKDEQLLELTAKDVTAEDESYSSGEESFYSESPVSSDETTSPLVTASPAGAVYNIALPEAAVTKQGSQSKKKWKIHQRKVAQKEFFRPICELCEDEDSVLATSDLSLTDMGSVLSLTELCLIKIKQLIRSKYKISLFVLQLNFLCFKNKNNNLTPERPLQLNYLFYG